MSIKLLSPQEFKEQIKNIRNKRRKSIRLTLYELYLEACDIYNEAIKAGTEQDRWYSEGEKNALQTVLLSGADPNMLIQD